jgi:hypothetical protein
VSIALETLQEDIDTDVNYYANLPNGSLANATGDIEPLVDAGIGFERIAFSA